MQTSKVDAGSTISAGRFQFPGSHPGQTDASTQPPVTVTDYDEVIVATCVTSKSAAWWSSMRPLQLGIEPGGAALSSVRDQA